MTSAEFLQYLQYAADGADVALPLLGEAELVPVVTAALALTQKIATAATAKSGDDVIAAAMAAARLAADALEAKKLGSSP
jgi:hypothetical protein